MRGRATTLADGNLILKAEGERLNRLAFSLQNFTISREDEMVLDSSADLPVNPLCGHRKLIGRPGTNFQEKSEGERGRIECRTKIGGGCGQDEFQLRYSR